jgi:hypothetical protein
MAVLAVGGVGLVVDFIATMFLPKDCSRSLCVVVAVIAGLAFFVGGFIVLVTGAR